MSTRPFAALILVVTAAALAYRLPGLGRRPMHADEAVHAYKLAELRQTGRYHYDPAEYHGPTLYYLTLPALWLNGAGSFSQMSQTMLRAVPALFGVGLVLLLWLVADGLGRPAALCAAVLTAICPALTYYSRYYIQETLLVFFTFALLACGWRYLRSGRTGWALAAGAAAGLMHATKETCIIALGALLAGLAGSALWHRRATGAGTPDSRAQNRSAGPPSPARRRPEALGAALLLALLVSVTLYSGFFRDAAGPLNSLRSYATYFDRAGGQGGHDHPWYYYLRLLSYTHRLAGPAWSEGLILALAAAGAAAALRGKGLRGAHLPFARFLAIYTVLMTAAYSTIPYKTPWCLLGFLHGMILLAGVGAVALLTWLRRPVLRGVAGALLLAAAVQLGWQAYLTNFRFHADERNPYAYAFTRPGTPRLARWIDRLAAYQPAGEPLVIMVVTANPWPLPWYLRGLRHVGYWEQPPPDPDAPLVIVSTDQQPAVEARLRAAYHHPVSYGFRPDATLWVYVRRDLWDRYERSLAGASAAGGRDARPARGAPLTAGGR